MPPRNTGFCLKNHWHLRLPLRRRSRVKLAPAQSPWSAPFPTCEGSWAQGPRISRVYGGDDGREKRIQLGLAACARELMGKRGKVQAAARVRRPRARVAGLIGSRLPARRARGSGPHRVGAHARPLLMHAVRLLHGLAVCHDPAPGGPPPWRPRGPGVRAAPRRLSGPGPACTQCVAAAVRGGAASLLASLIRAEMGGGRRS